VPATTVPLTKQLFKEAKIFRKYSVKEMIKSMQKLSEDEQKVI
jgi:hypothetical protein